MNRDLGFVIVGCGMIARFHARALAEVAGARLVGLVSRSTDAATKMATELASAENTISLTSTWTSREVK